MTAAIHSQWCWCVVKVYRAIQMRDRPEGTEEVTVWVWSDDLADRLGEGRSSTNVDGALVAYAVEPEMDLDEFAREILGAAAAGGEMRTTEGSTPPR